VSNIVALCPNHRREAHHGKNRAEIRERLRRRGERQNSGDNGGTTLPVPDWSAPALTGDEREALEAVHSLHGRFAGGEMLVHLLQERTRDRAREDARVRR